MAGAVTEKDQKDLRWRKLYEYLQNMPYGSLITYKELEDILESSPYENRCSIYRASKELERTAKRTLRNVRGQGYRVAEPKEHEGLALDQHRYARRRMGKAQRIISATERSMLTPEERARLSDLEARTGRIAQALKKHGQQIEDIQQRLDTDMEVRLSRIEQALQLQS